MVEAWQEDDDDGEWLDLDAPKDIHTTSSGVRQGDGTYRLLRRRETVTSHHSSGQETTRDRSTTDDDKQNHRSTLMTLDIQTESCRADGLSWQPFRGRDSPERLLVREGVLSEMPTSRCGNTNRKKNVILAIGDGMGYEMTRAGAIARQVIDELEGLGCNTTVGCPNNTAAQTAFRGRSLDDYYTEGT